MNGSTKLSLAIALALIGGGDAFALGLGAIQVKSGLNQPLNAEIAVIADSPAEATGLNVSLAKAEDFQRVGLDRARVSVPIDFEVITSGRQAVIRLTTKDPVREPFLDFLVEANWAKGRVLREYTVLLDPPVMAPALKGSTATVAPVREAATAPPTRLESAPTPKTKPAQRVKPPRAEVAEAKPPKPVSAPKPTPATAPTRTASAGEYGPVAQGETLSEIARATKDDNTDTNGMMLALLQANPNAFYKDNINALKRGAILRIPSRDDVKAAGTAAAAAAAVREQNQAWSSGNAPVAKPTLVATTGEPKSSSAATATKTAPTSKPNERLALVPPASGKGGQNTADQPGPASGTGSGTSSRADMARTKEALASREQEVGELKSRVKELEDMNGKDQRLLTLRQSEIADLQNKLKELQAKTSAAPSATTTTSKMPASTTTTTTTSTPPTSTTPSTTTVTSTTKPADSSTAKPEAKLTAQDIWGKISDSEKAPAKPATSTTTTTTPPSTTTSTSSATTPSSATTTAPLSSVTAPTSATAMTGPAPSSTSSSAPSTTTNSGSPSTASPAATTPASDASASAPVTPATTTSPPIVATATPAVSTPTPIKPKPVASIAPMPAPELPWYQNTMTLAIAGGALLLVGLLALMRFMRKPKPVVLVGDDGEVVVDEHHHEFGAAPVESEAELLDALAQHPGDPDLSLKLLRMYYAERDAAKFEAAAEAMYAHIADPTQPEWQEVKAMGEELVPHNPLFGGNDDLAGYMHEGLAATEHREKPHSSDDSFDLGGFDADGSPAAEENFDFDLTDRAAPAPAFEEPAHAMAPPVVAQPTLVPVSKPADDFFAGEDTIGTKLDLARAYLDMGDPEGARSMLDEVMTEGNDTQKGEARKLLAEIR